MRSSSRHWIRAASAVVVCLFSVPSPAHVELVGPGFAGQSQVLRFTIGHGCEGADTVRLSVTIPKEVTTLRALPTAFGSVELVRDGAGVVTSVAWAKDTARAQDEMFYEMAIRVKVPDAPFTRLYFPATQTCLTSDGAESSVDWKATEEEIAAAKEGEAPEPSPSLVVLPPRKPGWNKFTNATAITDLEIFDDAQIVWVGDAAYSSNPTTKEQIAAESDVTPLDKIAPGSEIWVRY